MSSGVSSIGYRLDADEPIPIVGRCGARRWYGLLLPAFVITSTLDSELDPLDSVHRARLALRMTCVSEVVVDI
jgi:hypothetical protein